VVNLIGSTLKKDQIQLLVEIPEGLPAIVVGHQEIEQILINLLMNSRDALNQRFPEHDEQKTIRIVAQVLEISGKQFVRITIEDRGSGIPYDIREHIFNPFFTTKSRAEGTGLGLAISLSIAQAHHGDLTYDSDETQLTRFHLDLPVP